MTSLQVLQAFAVLLFVVSAAFAAGCMASGSSNQISGNGTITFVETEGGFFGIVGDDGARHLPLNMSVDYRKSGLRVWFTGYAQSGTATIQQWGEPIEIIAMGQINDHATVTGSGTIRFIALEGGFYGILADDGNQYYPVNLDETYRVDGRRISFSAQLSDTATVVMWGEPVRITAIEDIGLCSVCRN